MPSELSIVRRNLLENKRYTPYCGNQDCEITPRTFFNGEQFECAHCHWVSSFEKEFIKKVKVIKDDKPRRQQNYDW
jgi:hypothetical protein